MQRSSRFSYLHCIFNIYDKMADFAARLKQFDAYPKTLEDFRIKTYGGAVVTGVSSFIMLVLFLSEFNYFITTEVHPELFVDMTRHQKLRINIDVVFPNIGCAFLSVDAVDVSGEQVKDIENKISKRRMDQHGKLVQETREQKCEDCYGAATPEQPCCNTCEEVRNAYRKKGWEFKDPKSIVQCAREQHRDEFEEQATEGCQVLGHIDVSKVAGNFHIAPGKSSHQNHLHVHDLQAFGSKQFNLTHQVRSLSFGDPIPGVRNPLDELNVTSESLSLMYQYFIKIVPSVYKKLSGEVVSSNQYSFTKHRRPVREMAGEHGLPGFFVLYELSPMLIQYSEKRRSFMHFLTGVCAIIGGVFTVAGLVDSIIYRSSKVLKKKMEIGKVS